MHAYSVTDCIQRYRRSDTVRVEVIVYSSYAGSAILPDVFTNKTTLKAAMNGLRQPLVATNTIRCEQMLRARLPIVYGGSALNLTVPL
jgi:hypothetical protein